MVFGGHGTSGPLQALLSQGVIPIVLVLSVIFMKTRYTWNQYLGAFFVLGTIFPIAKS
jgi:drug/metabolite transporter (DMT)-like permease